MNILRYTSRLVNNLTPSGMVLGGAALALAFPAVRKGIRSTAVAITRGIIGISDEARKLVNESKAEINSVLAEAKDLDNPSPSCQQFAQELSDLRTTPRKAAVAATAGILTVRDKAKQVIGNATEHIQGIVEEARNPKPPVNKGIINISPDKENPHGVVHDGLEGNTLDIPKH